MKDDEKKIHRDPKHNPKKKKNKKIGEKYSTPVQITREVCELIYRRTYQLLLSRRKIGTK